MAGPHEYTQVGELGQICVSLLCVCEHVCVSYLEGESVLAGAEPHVLHGGAVDHHLSHISAGHKHWAAGLTEEAVYLDSDDRGLCASA